MQLPLETQNVELLTASRYLARIGCEKLGTMGLDALRRLQYAHLHTVPYENLDILSGQSLNLETSALYKKIVEQGRGGYCFESNALFRQLLEQLGYELTSHFARFWRDEGNPPPKPRHHILLAKVEGQRWLLDVGVGGIVPRWPILLEAGVEQEQEGEWYRIMQRAPYGWMLEESVRGEWRPIFSFHDHPQLQRDFITTSFWCERAPESIFRQQPMVMLRTTTGRHTYDGEHFKIFDRDHVEVVKPTSVQQLADHLVELFGITIDDEQALAKLWQFQRQT